MTTSAKRGALAPALVLLSVLLLVALMVGGGIWLAGDGSRSIDPEPVRAVPSGQVAGGVGLGDSVVVVVSEEFGDFEGRTTLVRLDPMTGAEVESVELADWSAIDGVAAFDGDLVLRLRGRLPGVAAEELAWPSPPSLTGEFWLVVVDGDTLTPVRQWQLPPFDLGARSSVRVVEPLVVIDGVFWLLGASLGWGRIDLATGRADFGDSLIERPGRAAVRQGDHLVALDDRRVRVQDFATGEVLARYDRGDVLADPEDPAIFFRLHEGQVWLTDPLAVRNGFPVRLDLRLDLVPGRGLDSGSDAGANAVRTVDERPSTSIPSWVFESGGHRFELLRPGLVSSDRGVPTPEPGDRWRQVDPQSGQVIGELDLGAWQPRFATDQHLWVVGERVEGAGLELARLPLD